jgi:tetratricopeptide (TPR) repeat protein
MCCAAAFALAAQDPKTQKPAEVEPPEEDEAVRQQTEYTFNPLQAEQELKIGQYYLRKGSFRAAAKRFEEATKWNPSLGEAFLRWGEALAKAGDEKAAATAWRRYLEVEPQGKEAARLRKRLKL